jgi:hypothetical protein
MVVSSAAVLFFCLSGNMAYGVNECGVEAVGPDTVTCPIGSYATGITYSNSDGLTLELNGAAITVGNPGVSVASSAAITDAISITGTNVGTVTTGVDGARGLFSLISNAASTAAVTVNLTGGDVTTTGNVAAGGLEAQNKGLGNATAQMDGGAVTIGGADSIGVVSFVNNTASTATSTALLTGGLIKHTGVRVAGLFAQNTGQGVALAQMDGGSIITSGLRTAGIGAFCPTAGSTATCTALQAGGSIVTTAASSHGIRVFSNGSGATTTRMDGGTTTITGASAHGLYAQAGGLSLASGAISGIAVISASGVDAEGIRTQISLAGASYSVSATDTASVTGGSGLGAGIHTVSVADSSGTITVSAGTTVDGSAGTAGILDDAGNTAVTIAGTVLGNVVLGEGSDALTFESTADLSGIVIMDGGDDVATADGWIDILTFSGSSVALTAANVINWENVVVDTGSTVSLIGTQTLVTAELSLNAGGILSLGNGASSDQLTVDGDFVGGGTLQLDTQLGDNSSPSDVLTINGDTSGNTVINVTNVAGAGAATTGNGILVVEVVGTSGGTFSLGGQVRAGNYLYTLVKVGTDWYLQSTFSLATIPTLSQWAQIVLALTLAGMGLLGFRRRRV